MANISGRFDESVFGKTLYCVDSCGHQYKLSNGQKRTCESKNSIPCLLFSDEGYKEVGQIVDGKLILNGKKYNPEESMQYFQRNYGNLKNDKCQIVYFNPDTGTFDVEGPVYDAEGNRYYIGIDGKIDVMQTKLYLLYDYIINRMSATVGNDSPISFVEFGGGYSIERNDVEKTPAYFVKTKSGYSIGFVGFETYDSGFNCLTIGQYEKDSHLGEPHIIFRLTAPLAGRLHGNIMIGDCYISIGYDDRKILDEADSRKLDELIELMLDEVSELDVDNDMLKRYNAAMNLIKYVKYDIPYDKNFSVEQKLMKIIARINDVSDPYALMKLREVFESDINDGVSYGFYTEKAYLVAIEAVINSRLAELGYIGKNDLKGTSHK